MKLIVLLLVFFFFNETLFSQQEIDTTHSVKKTAFFSAILPGSGQVYNHLAMPKGKKNAWWKVPLIYAGLGGTGYMVIKNNILQKELKQEYKTRLAGNSGLEKYQLYDLQGIETLYNFHLNQRDLFILGFGVVYLIQVIDAAVEAHFVSFDISEDLTLTFSPTYFSMYQPGIKVSLKLVK